jgi:hypothetical protein
MADTVSTAPTRFRYHDGVLRVSRVALADRAAFCAHCAAMTLFQKCPVQLPHVTFRDCDELFACTVHGRSDAVVAGFILVSLAAHELFVNCVCAFVPRLGIGTALMHAAVAHAVARGATSARLYSLESADAFYARLQPSLGAYGMFSWRCARALLATLAARVGRGAAPPASFDSFWFHALWAYAAFLRTDAGAAIDDAALQDAAAAGNLAGAACAIEAACPPFAAFLATWRAETEETRQG